MRQPPAVTIYSRAQAQAAIEAAGPAGVLLLSAPGAAGVLGPAWFVAMVGSHAASALDCGDAPGHALAALRFGIRRIILARPGPALLSCATEMGAELMAERPPSLDLFDWNFDRPQARAALRSWLACQSDPMRRSDGA